MDVGNRFIGRLGLWREKNFVNLWCLVYCFIDFVFF